MTGHSSAFHFFRKQKAIHETNSAWRFPDPETTDSDGFLGAGADLEPATLLHAYSLGIFPWFQSGSPLWFSPPRRFIILPENFRIPRTVQKQIKRNQWQTSLDKNFSRVMEECSERKEGTWINPAMKTGYSALHEHGYAHSLEVYDNGKLIGGIYGVSLGRMFAAESMFYRESGASQFALVQLATYLFDRGFHFIDAQVYSEHVARFGGIEIPRENFLQLLNRSLREPTCLGRWLWNNSIDGLFPQSRGKDLTTL